MQVMVDIEKYKQEVDEVKLQRHQIPMTWLKKENEKPSFGGEGALVELMIRGDLMPLLVSVCGQEFGNNSRAKIMATP